MKTISYSILLVLLLSCEKDLYENIQHPQPIVHNLLYQDNGGNLYLKIFETFEKTNSQIEIFFDDVQINDSSIALLKDVIDLKSFRLIDDQQYFFRDKNYIYVYNKYPSADHPLRRLDLDQENARIVGDYIFDDEDMYHFGTRLKENEDEVRDSLIGLIPRLA